ncbi:hypothetical protein C8R44DRAFT_741201 [Mycena epipterygia]|nr:hypothetical protein C8R44DRAFT_741201 [Mycena epipterygia]
MQTIIPIVEKIELDNITGGLGGTGGNAKISGEESEGEGPQLELSPNECWKIGNVSGGTGGTGGDGIEIGGKGGTGKAPVIRRRNPALLVEAPEEDDLSILVGKILRGETPRTPLVARRGAHCVVLVYSTFAPPA